MVNPPVDCWPCSRPRSLARRRAHVDGWTSSSRSNLAKRSTLGWGASHLLRESARVRARPLLSVGIVTQLDTHLRLARSPHGRPSGTEHPQRAEYEADGTEEEEPARGDHGSAELPDAGTLALLRNQGTQRLLPEVEIRR